MSLQLDYKAIKNIKLRVSQCWAPSKYSEYKKMVVEQKVIKLDFFDMFVLFMLSWIHFLSHSSKIPKLTISTICFMWRNIE